MKAPIDKFVAKIYPQGSITQFFGENPTLYGRFGLKGHNGVDIVAPHGSPLYAVCDGIINDVKLTPTGYGKHIRILSNEKDVDGDYHEWGYGHCSKIHVKVGDKVKAGEHVADMGNTGFVISGSTPFWDNNPYAGTHLHLGLRKAKRSKEGFKYHKNSVAIKIQNYTNGFKGAVDPIPYLFPQSTNRRQKMITIISLLNTLVGLLQEKVKKNN